MRRLLIPLLALALPFAVLPHPALARPTGITPPPPIFPIAERITSNAGSGDQSDVHVNGNLAVYTDDDFLGNTTVRLFNFATNSDTAIPGQINADSLADVSGTRVAHTEATINGPQVIVFDTSTNVRLVTPGFGHARPAINGTTVAYEERLANSGTVPSDIVVYDVTTATSTRLTNDSLLNTTPAIGPAGNIVVWRKCQLAGTGCAIYQASRSGATWGPPTAVTGPEGEAGYSTDTNGSLIVYTSTRNGETHVYYKPVTGGPETQLALPGDQRGARIAGSFISFEGRTAAGNFDSFVYDIATNTLYQLTQTPVDETLSRISVLPDGRVRVVYSAPSADYNAYAATFLPNAPATTYPLTLAVSQLQLHTANAGTTDKVQVQGTLQLAATSDGINPATQPVALRLSTAAGQFYPPPTSTLMPITGFDVTTTGWAINTAEKQRTGLQTFTIDRTTTGYSFSLVDTKVPLPTIDYSTVKVELVIGNDAGTTSASLLNNPLGSGNWQLR